MVISGQGLGFVKEGIVTHACIFGCHMSYRIYKPAYLYSINNAHITNACP